MKYIITQEQVDAIDIYAAAVSGPASRLAQEILRSLKPIEPLTDDRIAEIEKHGVFWVDGTPTQFARAIESAITGEQHEQ